jgi:putative membrane protein
MMPSDEIADNNGPAAVSDEMQLPLRYLHPVSLVFEIISHIRSYAVPLVFGLVGAANSNVTLLIVSGILFIPALATSIFRYFTLRYRIEDRHLVVNQGLLFRQTRTVPIERIQNVDLTQNVMHRLLGVAEVKIETASGTEAEAVLRVLSMAQVDALRDAIFSGRSAAVVSAEDSERGDALLGLGEESSRPPERILVWKIPVGDLVRAGLASNRGLVMVGILLGTAVQFSEDRFGSFFKAAYKYLPEDAASFSFIWTATAFGILALAGMRLLGIAWFILRFYGYRLEQRGDDLRLGCGLLTKVSATVPRKRIQFISVQRNLIMRWFKLASIRIETAGGAVNTSNPSEAIAKSWFLPVLPEREVKRLIELLRPELSWDESSLDFKPLAPRTRSRLMRLAFLQSLLLAGVGAGFFWPWGWVAGLVALPLLLLWAAKKSKSMNYARTDNVVVYRSGVLNRKTSLTFFEKIQTLELQQSPFDRRWGMARLRIDTAAAGPAEHLIAVPYLGADFAKQEFLALRKLSVGDCEMLQGPA